ncbi:hypothetical protein ACTMTF_15155 [Nonomuraea sp. ZG12]|uniref:hypothetical protein n=1 Tax=Nonomuraea sp. ZG12 TaxID=3452207 RepID=UPI003F8A1201
MAITSVTAVEWNGSCDVSIVDGLPTAPVPVGNVGFRIVVDRAHTVGIFVDNVLLPNSEWPIDTSSTYTIQLKVPNDGLDHKIQFIDDGTHGNPAAKSSILTAPAIDCAGFITFEALGEATHPVTKEKYVKVRVANTGAVNETLLADLFIDPSATFAEYLEPGESKVITGVVPADGNYHQVEGRAWRIQPDGGFAFHGHLMSWGIKANPTPPPAEDPTSSATVFTPGETIYVSSATDSTPLAVDGSEWILLEIRERPEAAEIPEPWRLIGTEGGFVLPQQDGSWVSSILTDETSYPLGTKWDLRARRFQEYRPSEEYLQYFNMGETGGEEPEPPSIPFILGPNSPFPDGIMRLNTWVTLYGSGTPGSVIEFQAAHTSSGSEGEETITPNTPASCTVGADGRWQTRIYEFERGPYSEVWIVAYRARAQLNGQTTEWSGPSTLWWADH